MLPPPVTPKPTSCSSNITASYVQKIERPVSPASQVGLGAISGSLGLSELGLPLVPADVTTDDQYIVTPKQLRKCAKYCYDRLKTKISKETYEIGRHRLFAHTLNFFKGLNNSLKFWESELYKSDLIYIMSYCNRIYQDPIVSVNNFGTLLTVCTLVAVKFNHDHPFRNSWYAKKFNVSLEIINASEIVLLEKLGYNCTVSEEEYAVLNDFLDS